MTKFLKSGPLVLLVLSAIAVIGTIILTQVGSNRPDAAKLTELGDAMQAGCRANSVAPVVSILHNGRLLEELSLDDFVAEFGKAETSIPYDKKDKGRMFPVLELFDIKRHIEFIQFVTCAPNQELIFSKSDLMTRPDPLYWMRKNKGIISIHSMVYDESKDTSVKTDFRARPILKINLIRRD